MLMRFVIPLLLLLVVALQYKAWFSDSGYFAVERLRAQVAEQELASAEVAERNRRLRAEVMALKDGHEALEARAREDLGMVREGEVFFLVAESEQ